MTPLPSEVVLTWLCAVLLATAAGAGPAKVPPAKPGARQPGATRPEAGGAAPEVAALRFGWKPGLVMEVTSTRSRSRQGLSPRPVTMGYRVLVEADGGRLRVNTRDTRVVVPEGQGPAPAGLESLAQQAANLIPDFYVSPGGDFLGVTDLEALREGAKKLALNMLPADVAPEMKARIEALVGSDELLTSKVAEEWNGLISAWAGSDLEIGETYVSEVEEPIPMLQGAVVTMSYQFTAKRFLDCRRGGTVRRCVELEMLSTPDPEDLQTTIAALIAKLAPEARSAMSALKTVEIESVLLLVAEPDGLLPHRSTLTRTSKATAGGEGQEQTMTQEERRETTYSYP